ncbi:Cullin-2 [Aphelenchoides fujianensis]|nr:Cullin-2 [Aphelenchoides fujianensis]
MTTARFSPRRSRVRPLRTRKAPSSEKLNFYEEFFEEKFLRETDEYFKRTISQEFFSDLSRMFDYMTKAKKILENEERLCRQFLFGPTVEKTLKLQRIAFVLYQLDRFAEVVPQYVRSESKKELNLAYGLLSPFSEGGQPAGAGVREVRPGCAPQPAEVARDDRRELRRDRVLQVQLLQGVHGRGVRAIARALQRLPAGHRVGVNDDRENEKFFAAKMIARHMDQLLRKSTKTSRNSDIEEKMEEAVTVFRFVKDKDAFLKIYQRMFSTRLLGKFISSMELESLMIEKLRNACGHDYTNKLVRMYTDYDNSRSLTEEFKTSGCKCEHHPEDEFTIIQTCAWPVTCSKDEQHMNSFIIPKWLLSTTECFKKFYEAKYNGRVLNYAYHVSTADIGVNVGTRKCVATMTVPQAVLLLSFESNDELAIGKISEAIGLTFETTCNCLKALIDFKILQVQPPRSQYTPESVVAVNLEFQAQRSRVHLPPPTINTRVQESASAPIQRETIQDRKVAVECAIVRAMKTNKVMKHGDLINVVIEITKQRFVPEVSFVKQTIEGLIDKHFIQRSNAVDEYEYLS